MLPGVCARHHHLYYQPYVPMALTLSTIYPKCLSAVVSAFVAVALHGMHYRTARESGKLSGIMRVVWTRLPDCRGNK